MNIFNFKPSKFLYFIFIIFTCAACSDEKKLPVEILGVRSGVLSTGADGKTIFKAINEIDANNGEGLYWYIFLRTNRDLIKYEEEIKMSGPTTWGSLEDKTLKGDKYIDVKVSDDKSSVVILKEIATSHGIISSSWRFDKDEPRGPISINVTFEGKVISTFNWNLK